MAGLSLGSTRITGAPDPYLIQAREEAERECREHARIAADEAGEKFDSRDRELDLTEWEKKHGRKAMVLA